MNMPLTSTLATTYRITCAYVELAWEEYVRNGAGFGLQECSQARLSVSEKKNTTLTTWANPNVMWYVVPAGDTWYKVSSRGPH